MKGRNMRDMIDTELSELRTDKMEGKKCIQQWISQENEKAEHAKKEYEKKTSLRIVPSSYGSVVKKLALAAAVFGCVLLLGHTAGAKIGDLTSYLASVFGMTKEQEVEYASYLEQNKKEMLDATSVDNTKVSVREVIYASDMVICLVEVEKPNGTLDKSYQFREQDIKLTYKDGTKDNPNLTLHSSTSDQVEISGNRALYRYCFGIGTDISNVAQMECTFTDFGKRKLVSDKDSEGMVEAYSDKVSGTWRLNWDVKQDKSGVTQNVNQKITIDFNESGEYSYEEWKVQSVSITPFSLRCNVTPANAKKFATIDGGIVFGEFIDGILLKDGKVIDTKNTTSDEIYTTVTNKAEDLTSGSETVVFAKALDVDSIVGIIINGDKILFDK